MSDYYWLWCLSGKTQTAPFNTETSVSVQKRQPHTGIYTQKRLETVNTVKI